MGNLQARFIDHFPAKQNQIEIKRPRSAGMWAFPSAFTLDREQLVYQLAWRDQRLANDGAIQKICLRWNTDGHCVVPTRDRDCGKNVVQPADGKTEVGLAIAHVAAEGDGDSIQSSAFR